MKITLKEWKEEFSPFVLIQVVAWFINIFIIILWLGQIIMWEFVWYWYIRATIVFGIISFFLFFKIEKAGK